MVPSGIRVDTNPICPLMQYVVIFALGNKPRGALQLVFSIDIRRGSMLGLFGLLAALCC